MDNISIKTPVVAVPEQPCKKRKYSKSADGKPKTLGPFADPELLEKFNQELDAMNKSDHYPFKMNHKQFLMHLLKVNAKWHRRIN